MIRSALAACMLLAAAMPGAAQTSAEVSAQERARFSHGELRPGADGNDPQAPNRANFDPAKVGTLAPPPLFLSSADGTRAGWSARADAIRTMVEDEFVGRIPAQAADLRIVWTSQREGSGDNLVGQLIGPAGRMGPVIDGVLSLPPGTAKVPVVIEYSYIWPPGFRLPGPPAPTLREVALAHGWGHFAYRPTLLQADDLARLSEGVIGLAKYPREEHDWGALRAWGWGASRLREHLSANPRIDSTRISLAGHSRFGKAVLVAAAFDHGFADALVSSSGAGGAKLMRRDFGERMENMADPYASIWYAPRIRHYAGRAGIADWPVDAHMLIALRAPRPLLVATGLASEGDGWTDPDGQWIATTLAQPAWEVLGRPVPRTGLPHPLSLEQAHFPLGWYQHDMGHVMYPAFGAFFDHADRFASSAQ